MENEIVEYRNQIEKLVEEKEKDHQSQKRADRNLTLHDSIKLNNTYLVCHAWLMKEEKENFKIEKSETDENAMDIEENQLNMSDGEDTGGTCKDVPIVSVKEKVEEKSKMSRNMELVETWCKVHGININEKQRNTCYVEKTLLRLTGTIKYMCGRHPNTNKE